MKSESIIISITPDRLSQMIQEGVLAVLKEMQQDKEEVYISPKKAARILDCSVRSLENYRELKKYRNPNYVKLVRYKKSEVLNFLKTLDF